MFLQWIIVNIGTIIAGLVVAVILFFIIRGLIKNRKKGFCNCGCSDCNGQCAHCVQAAAGNKKDIT